MMKNKTIPLFILLVISIIANICILFEVKKLKKADVKQEKIFTEVADSLTYFRLQRDSLKMVHSSI